MVRSGRSSASGLNVAGPVARQGQILNLGAGQPQRPEQAAQHDEPGVLVRQPAPAVPAGPGERHGVIGLGRDQVLLHARHDLMSFVQTQPRGHRVTGQDGNIVLVAGAPSSGSTMTRTVIFTDPLCHNGVGLARGRRERC